MNTLDTQGASTALFNQGNARFREGRWDEAEKYYAQALAQLPASASAQQVWLQVAMQHARCAVQQERWSEARERFAEVLRRVPTHYSAWLESGHVCQHRGGLQQQMQCYQRAIAADPQRWGAHASLARVLWKSGHADAAALAFWQATQCADVGDGYDLQVHAGRSLLDAGLASQALPMLARALQVRPDDYLICLMTGDVLMQLGATQHARGLFDRAAQAQDNPTLTRLAERLMFHNEWEASERVLRRVMALYPQDWSAPLNLARLLLDLFRVEEALALLDQAQALTVAAQDAGPQVPAELQTFRALAQGKQGDMQVAVAEHCRAAEFEGPMSVRRSAAAMTALYCEQFQADEVSRLHRELFAPLVGLFKPPVFDLPPIEGRALRVGYVTADFFRQHPVNLFMQPVLAHHDPAQVAVTVYYNGEMVDEQTRMARSRVAQWREVRTLSDESLTELIRSDGMDVLVDLSGHTNLNRRGVLVRRAAPVQVSFLGYPSTSGLPNMDFIVADPVVAPVEQEPLYSEHVLRLPHAVFCYAPQEDYPLPVWGDDWLLRPPVLGSFGNAMKLTPATVALWSQVLLAVPGSRLLLKSPSFADPSAVERLTEGFVAHGVARACLEFRGPSGLAAMMAEYADVDIVLDSTPYNGGTTTLQALWMGCPVVTLAGEGFCQRMGASGVTAASHPEWIAQSAAQFVQIAQHLLTDRVELKRIKRDLRADYLRSPASGAKAYTRALEGLYRQAWQIKNGNDAVSMQTTGGHHRP